VATIKKVTLDHLPTAMAVLGTNGNPELCKGKACKYLDLSSTEYVE
jgi:hypothetical protein